MTAERMKFHELVSGVKGYAGDVITIRVGLNYYGILMFSTSIHNNNYLVGKQDRWGQTFLGWDALLKKYPSLRPRQKELQDKILLSLYGEKKARE